MKNLIFCLGLIVSVFFLACEKDPIEPVIDQNPEVPTNQDSPENPQTTGTNDTNSIEYYFNRFEQEAINRGFDINLAALGIIYNFEDIEQEFVAGSCTYNSHSPNQVTIDTEFWQIAPNAIKEMVVFHELGHCVLGRDHREGRDTDGFCISIMRSGDGSCKDGYNSQTKDYYMAELFNEFYFNELFN